jgi:putative ATP-dependent endonuclease of the OLD family
MLLKAIRIERFRCIRNETLSCDPLTILLGPNGAGKSTWLQALRVFYDINARITAEDFYGRVTADPIVLRSHMTVFDQMSSPNSPPTSKATH